MLSILLEFQKGILIIRFNGSLNYQTKDKITNQIIPILKKHHIQYLVYNCQDLLSIDSSGKQTLREMQKVIRQNDGIQYIVNLPDKLRPLMSNLNLIEVPSEKIAVNLLRI